MDTPPPYSLAVAPATPPRRMGPRLPPPSPLSPTSTALLDSVLEFDAVRRLNTKRIVRKSRDKRKNMQAAMQTQRDILEIVAANVGPALLGPEEDFESDEEDDTKRVRRFLRKSKALIDEQRHEERVRDELLRRLRIHTTSVAALTKLIQGMSVDSWFWNCERWSAMTREHFKPWPLKRCEQMMQESIDIMADFEVPDDLMAKNPLFFGWKYYYYMKGNRGYFTYQKAYKRSDIDTYAEIGWAMYRDTEQYMMYVISQPTRQNRSYHHLLQEVAPNLFILQTLDQLPGIESTFHNVLLVFRIKTESGYRIGLRSIPVRALDEVMKGDGVFLLSDFYWLAWDVTDRDDNGDICEYTFTYSGSVCAEARREYALWWLSEVVMTLAKAEALVVGFQPVWLAT